MDGSAGGVAGRVENRLGWKGRLDSSGRDWCGKDGGHWEEEERGESCDSHFGDVW